MESLILNGTFDLWDFICDVFFSSNFWVYIISGVLYMAGLMLQSENKRRWCN